MLWVGMRPRVKKCKPPRSLVSPSSWTVITFCLVRRKKRWTDLARSQIYWPVIRWAGVKLPSFNMYEAPGQASWEVLGMQRFLRQSPCHWEANALVRETSRDRPPSGFRGRRHVSHLWDLQMQPVVCLPEKPAREPHLKKVTSPDKKH